jgi:hypothetical protein
MSANDRVASISWEVGRCFFPLQAENSQRYELYTPGQVHALSGMKAIEREWKIERQHSKDNPWNRLNSIYSQIFHAIPSHQVDKSSW